MRAGQKTSYKGEGELFSKSIRLRLSSHADESDAKQLTALAGTWQATLFDKVWSDGLTCTDSQPTQMY